MAKQNGALIKEKRTAAGMSQDALSKASGVSANAISKVERGIKDLSPEQLEAVAKALDAAPESLLVDDRVSLSDEEKELIELYRSADANTQQAATSALKGEAPQNQNPMAAMMSMFGGMAGGNGEGGDNPMAAMMGGNGEGGEAGANPMAAMMSMFGGMAGGNGEGGDNPMAAMMGGNGEGGEAGANPMAAMMSMFGGMAGGNGEGGEAGANPMAAMMSMFGGMAGGNGEEKKEQPAEEQPAEEQPAEEQKTEE